MLESAVRGWRRGTCDRVPRLCAWMSTTAPPLPRTCVWNTRPVHDQLRGERGTMGEAGRGLMVVREFYEQPAANVFRKHWKSLPVSTGLVVEPSQLA